MPWRGRRKLSSCSPGPWRSIGSKLEGYDYPELHVQIECGSGTYVRSLGRDLAESLGTAAVMSRLTRTAIGGFRVEEAIDPECSPWRTGPISFFRPPRRGDAPRGSH